MAAALLGCTSERQSLKPEDPTGRATRTLVMRGGGWESAEDLEPFESLLKDGKIAIVLSATTYGSAQGTQYFFDWYGNRLSHALDPIYTYANAPSGSANSAANPAHGEKIAASVGVIITGGDPFKLQHVVGSKLGEAIKKAYEAGIPIYANSAGLSILGPTFTWDLSTGTRGKGLGLISAPVISHVNDFGLFCDLWNLVPAYAKQGFGISKDTVAVVTNNQLRTHPISAGKIYHYQVRPQSGCTPPAVGASVSVPIF